MLKCKCGEILEDGFMGCLWCPVCENNWKLPDGQENNPDYFMTLKLME